MRHLLSTLAAALVLPLAATAAEEAHGAGEAAPSLFAGDVGVALWTLLIFAAVVFILGKYAWKPLLSSLQAREDFIRDSLQRAREEREQAERRLHDYEEKLAAARAEATALVDEGRRDAETVKAKIEAAAREEGDKLMARARREIELARDKAVKDLHTTSARLATDLAAKVLEREIRPEDHERLLAESLRELGERASN
ncbi:MAG: F0F1 ATP synthase subunit B [Thermoanaerobaculia bacterium]